MKILPSLKKCIAIFSLLCGIIVASNVNAQNFTYNDLIFEVISSGQVRIEGHVNGPYVTGEVDIPASVNYNGLNYVVVTIGNSAFSGCSHLTSVTIPNTVTTIGNSAFWDCSHLTSIIIPNSVTRIGDGAFSSCSGLTSITIPNSVTIIGNSAFRGCSHLTSITIPNTVTTIGDHAFWGCSGLTAINVNSSNPIYDSRNNCNAIIKTADNKLIAGCMNTIIPNSVTRIGDGAFGSCSGLISITIPNSVTTIGNSAFWSCSGLTSITIPNSVTTISNNAFEGCSGLTSITIPNSVIIIGKYAFRCCSGLTSIIISNSVTTIEDGAFGSCSGITGIIIPNSVTRIGDGAFISCSGLTGIIIPNTVTTIGDYAFAFCSGLTSIIIPNTVTTIGDRAFASCSGLTVINVDNGNPIYDSRNNCNAIIKTADNKLITGCMNTIIPNSVRIIADSAFEGCTGLTSITIPNLVTTIGNHAFSDCSSLTTVISFSQIPPDLGDNVFSGIGTATLFVPQYCVPLYIASNWYDYFITILEYHESVSENDEINVSVYPNPTAGKIIVEADNIKNISIFNDSGQLIYETPATSDTFEYDFCKYGAGVYIVKIETLKGIVTKKVTVK